MVFNNTKRWATLSSSQIRMVCQPLVYNLGEHSLIITSDYGTPDAFELVAPRIDEETLEVSSDSPITAIFDYDETYRLYQCLHTLFQPTTTDE